VSVRFTSLTRMVFNFQVLVVFLMVSGGGLSGQPGPGVIPVGVAPVEVVEDFGDTIEGVGTARANEAVVVTANVTETVEEILFEDGDTVEAGQVLVRLRQGEEQAELKAAQARLDVRKASFARVKGLEQQQAVSTAALQESEALLREDEGDLEVALSQIEDRVIRAPFGGVLGLREISVGALVRPGDEITTLDDLSRIKVDFEVPAIYLSSLRPGLEVEGRTRAYLDRVFMGTVQMVSSRVNPVTRTVTVRAVLPNEDRALRPGLLLSMRLGKNPRTALLIPEGAVVQSGQQSRVFLVVEDESGARAELTEVELGTRVPGRVEVLTGLDEGDRVVVHGLMQVRDGGAVRVVGVQTDPDQPLTDFLENAQTAGAES